MTEDALKQPRDVAALVTSRINDLRNEKSQQDIARDAGFHSAKC